MQFLSQHLILNESDLKSIKEFKNKFRNEIERRFTPNDEKICKSPAVIASVLDPKFKELEFFDKKFKKLVYNEVIEQMEVISPNESNVQPIESQSTLPDSTSKTEQKSAFEEIFGKREKTEQISINDEFKAYLSISFDSNSDPIIWWKISENRFPRLSRLAQKYLSIPSTSVSSERLFSTAGNLITKKRTGLKPDLVNNLVFLNINSKSFDTNV